MPWLALIATSLLLSPPPPPAPTVAPSADAAPSAVRLPAPAPGAPFAALLKTPQTLVYETDGIAVACHIEDAGVAGSDVDFRVQCNPAAAARARRAWTCARSGYLESPGSRPAFLQWRAKGCYAVRADGLWYFPSCPADAAGIARPAPKTRRELPTDLASWVRSGTELVPTRIEYGGGSTSTYCRAERDEAMMKRVEVARCASADFGWVASAALYVEPVDPDVADAQTLCRDLCVLTAVTPGLGAFEAGEPAPLDADAQTRIVDPLLREGERVAADVLVGAFGPSGATAIVITEKDARFGAFAVLDLRGTPKRLDLPPPGEWNAGGSATVLAVNVDGDGQWEAVFATSQMAGAGPEAAVEFPVNVVLRWDGQQFVRLAALEKRIEKLTNIKRIRAALKR